MSSIAGNGGMVQRAAESDGQELKLRLLSALVLGPVALTAVYVGSPYFETLISVSVLVMTWEWDRLCGGGRFGSSGYMLAVAAIAALVCVAAGQPELAIIVAVAGAGAVYTVARLTHHAQPLWISAGAIVIVLPCATLIWLRFHYTTGVSGVFWLIGAVWITDIAGFVFGRMIGGPRLAPSISPGKTWAGLIGAVVMTALWGLLWAAQLGMAESWPIIIVGAVTAVVAQGGDLAISVVKRRFGAKDASKLIPGHGGVLDRFDGMLAAAPALSALVVIKSGGIFSW